MYEQQQQPFSTAHRLWLGVCVCVCDSAKLQAQHQATVTIFLHRKSDFFPNTKKNLKTALLLLLLLNCQQP